MKLRIQSIKMACLALFCALFASCNDDALVEASQKYAGKFELTVTQANPESRLELGQNGLTTEWEPGDKLVLVKKGGGVAPIYLACDLSQNASSATFISESAVPQGEYYVIYNYNENLAYTHNTFKSVTDINNNDMLMLWGELTVGANTSSAAVTLQHLYTKIKVELLNVPSDISSNLKIGMYSSKKGFAFYKQITSNGLEDVEYGYNPNLTNWMGSSSSYFKSNIRKHNVCLGELNGQWINDPMTMNGSYSFSNSTELSALVLPEDLRGEDVYFYILGTSYTANGNSSKCYEIKKEDGVNFKAGTNYNVQLDLSKAVVSELVRSASTNGMPDGNYQIEDVADWRHAAYLDYGSFELMNDIDFTNECFFPIQAYGLKGNDKKISNINLDWSDQDNVGLIRNEYVGMYGVDGMSRVSDLTLENVTFKGYNCVGAFGGKGASVSNCKVIGESTIIGQGDYVGGLVGCSNLDHSMYKASIGQFCTVIGKNYVGGIVGRAMTTDQYNNDLRMYSSKVLYELCTSEATVTATGDYAGGIFGKIGGSYTSTNSSVYMDDWSNTYTFSLLKCVNLGAVNGVNYVGGIGGEFAVQCSDQTIVDRVVLKESYNEGNVRGKAKVAGILGASYASINTCYSIGEVDALESQVGGIAGYMDGMTAGGARIANCYSLATLSVGTNGIIGGIIGDAGVGLNIINSYYAANPNIYSFGGIVGYTAGYCNVKNCLTTLASLGNNLGSHKIRNGVPDDNNDGLPDYWSDTDGDGDSDNDDLYFICNDIITNSYFWVTSIKDNINIINDAQNVDGDKKYSDTDIWSGYNWECVKFASFSIDFDSPDLGDDTIRP